MAELSAEIEAALRQARIIARIYQQAERDLLAAIARHAGNDLNNDDPAAWARDRLADIRALRRQAERIVNRLRRAATDLAEAAVAEAWRAGTDQAIQSAIGKVTDARIRKRLVKILRDARSPGDADLINPGQGVAELARQLADRLTEPLQGAVRAVEDIYQQVIADAVGPMLAGTRTLREAVQEALDRFADRGITGFTDRSGRTWGLREYAEMAARTAAIRAAVDGHAAQLVADGFDLVIVSRHAHPCPICAPWEGQVLSLTGLPGIRRVEHALGDGEYLDIDVAASLPQARAAGLHHPNCRHNISAYLPGLTEPDPVPQVPGGYADTQKQRRLERQIRKWKKRQAAAVDKAARERARRRLRRYRQRLTEHLEATGLSRSPGRT